MRRERAWCWWVAIGVMAIAGYLMLPGESVIASVALCTIGVVAALVSVAAVRVHRPERAAMWWWFTGGLTMFVLGDVTFECFKLVLHEEPYPSIADAFYLAAYPMYVTGFLMLLRRQRGRDTSGFIDAAIVATSLGLAFWIFILHPIAVEEAASTLERWISTTYPSADVLLLAMVARLFTQAGGRTASTRLLGAGAVLTLVADTTYSLVSLYAEGYDQPINAIFLLSYVCWAAAALHPSMAQPAAEPAAAARLRPVRLGVFALCSLLSPILMFLPGVGDDPADRNAAAIGSIALFLLVIARLGGTMTSLRRQSAEVERLAMGDDLTGLANRRRLEIELREATARGMPQVALLSLNGFKNVNDELGRPVGDRVLGALADRLASAVPAGALVARTGGDEFAVLLPDATPPQAARMAEHLVAALRLPVVADGRELLVGIAIGIAGGARIDAVELLRQAEAAMYAAKRTGESVLRWTPSLDARSTAFAQMGAELRTALDTGQFRLFYQPIVDVVQGRVRAVEALVRWEHPEHGLVGPSAFIPVAEQNGLIVELGAWIMRTACTKLAAWRSELGGLAPARVSVNVSARQLARAGYAESVAAILAETGLPADCLAVEVTETAVFEGGASVAALHELRALGVRIALDDFGTGHSSLGLLQMVPVHTLKVDKSFVDNITAAGRHAVIAEALIQISHGLGLTAVAEGVETAEQAEVLSRLGYRYLQGFYFGRPAPELDFTAVRPAPVAA